MTQWTETVNWLFSHFIHCIPVHFISFEQFTYNLSMALFTSQQEAVQASLEEGWETNGTFTWHHIRTQRHFALDKSVGGIVEQKGSTESMCSKCKSAQNPQVSAQNPQVSAQNQQVSAQNPQVHP